MRTLAAATVLCLAATVTAQTTKPEERCPSTALALPPELAGWRTPTPLTAATARDDASRADLAIGRAFQLRLSAEPLRYAVRPERPPAPGSHGGVAGFTVARAGTYRVALGAGMWMDVVRDGEPIVSAAHGHGPACGGIRKTVDFRLTPGRHLLQISGGKEPTATVMVAAIG